MAAQRISSARAVIAGHVLDISYTLGGKPRTFREHWGNNEGVPNAKEVKVGLDEALSKYNCLK